MSVGIFFMMLFIGIIAIVGNFIIPLLNILYFAFAILGIICICSVLDNKGNSDETGLSGLKIIGIVGLTGALLGSTYVCKSRIIEIQSMTGLEGLIVNTFGIVVILFFYYVICLLIISGMMWLAGD